MSEIPIEINITSGLIAIGIPLLMNSVLAMAALPASRTCPASHSINPTRIKHSNESVRFRIRRPNGESAVGAVVVFPGLSNENYDAVDFGNTARVERTSGRKT